MKSRQIKRIMAILALSASFATTMAQEKAAPKPEAKAADQETEAAVQGPLNDISVGWFDWNLSGNRQRLDQYSTPPNGFFIENLSLFSFADEKNPFTHFTFRGTPEKDFVGQGTMVFGQGRGWAQAKSDQYNYSDTSPVPIPGSSDHDTKAEMSYALTPDLGLFASFRSKAADHSFEAHRPFNSLTNIYSVAAEGKVLQGQAGASFTGTTFNDRDGMQPDWTRNNLQAHYGRELTSRLAGEASYSYTKIVQSGAPDGKINVYGLDAEFDLSPASTLFFNLRREDFDLPVIQNATVQRRIESSLNLDGAVARQRFNLGFQHREARLLNAAHSYVDVPTWNKFSGRLSGKAFRDARYSANAYWEHFSKGNIDPQADEPFKFFWDDRVFAQAKVEGGDDRFSWYAAETFRLNRNGTSEVQIRTYDNLLGGSYSFDPRTIGFLEFSHENAAAQGVDGPGGLSLDQFFPTGTTLAFGLDHALPNNASVTLNVNYTITSYVNPLILPDGNFRSTQVTAQYRRKCGKDGSMSLTLAPWEYKDTGDPLFSQYGYRATLIGISYSNKF